MQWCDHNNEGNIKCKKGNKETKIPTMTKPKELLLENFGLGTIWTYEFFFVHFALLRATNLFNGQEPFWGTSSTRLFASLCRTTHWLLN